MFLTVLFFVVYAGYIGWVQLLILPALCRVSSARIAQRNPEWLCNRPEFAERLYRRRLPVLFSQISGLALLGALGFAAFARQPLEAMTAVLEGSLLAGLLFILVEAWSYWRLNRHVPAPAKRVADLASTRHRDHAPTPLMAYWYAALFAALALYGFAYVEGIVERGQAGARMIGIGLIIVLSWVSYRQTRKQPAQPGQQKVGIGVMAFCLLVVLGRVAQDFLDAPQFNEIWLWFFFAVALQVGFAVATIHAIRKGKAPPGSSTAPAAVP